MREGLLGLLMLVGFLALVYASSRIFWKAGIDQITKTMDSKLHNYIPKKEKENAETQK